MDDEGPPARQAFDSAPSFGFASSDDSYDAALRAADALFSGRAPRSDCPEPSPSSEPSMDGGRGRGRILQAIDDKPGPLIEEEFAAPKRRGRKPGSKNKPKVLAPDARPTVSLEAARAAVEVHEARIAGSLPRQAPAPRPTRDRVVPATSTPYKPSFPPAPSVSRDGGNGSAGVPVAAQSSARAAAKPSRRLEPFFWVRTKLKPGENWKRRLPKVIW